MKMAHASWHDAVKDAVHPHQEQRHLISSVSAIRNGAIVPSPITVSWALKILGFEPNQVTPNQNHIRARKETESTRHKHALAIPAIMATGIVPGAQTALLPAANYLWIYPINELGAKYEGS